MIFFLFLGWIFSFDGDNIIKELNKYLKIIKHKYILLSQNQKFQIEMIQQRRLYDNKKAEIKRNTEIRINKMISTKKEEIKRVEQKYQKIITSLDNIKNKDDLINFLNNLK